MRVRSLLPFGIRAVASVLHEGHSLAELAIGEHGKYGNAPSRVIRHEYIFSGFVDRDVAGVGAA